MEVNLVPLSVLTDDELLSRVYADRENSTDVVVELATRLEHALAELGERRVGTGDVVTRQELKHERSA